MPTSSRKRKVILNSMFSGRCGHRPLHCFVGIVPIVEKYPLVKVLFLRVIKNIFRFRKNIFQKPIDKRTAEVYNVFDKNRCKGRYIL